MRTTLDEIAPVFAGMAHSIGIGVAATVDVDGRPHTRPVQPVWERVDGDLVGWMTSEATAPKIADVRHMPELSVTYWNPEQDTCTADCVVEVVTDDAERVATWDRFLHAPGAAQIDLSTHPAWDGPTDPAFAVLRLRPTWLRVMPGRLMTAGEGDVLTWRR
ncbi:MAG TPA: pyridoxamine 5'-phosphate oxidase family protein [Iamia sp.]